MRRVEQAERALHARGCGEAPLQAASRRYLVSRRRRSQLHEQGPGLGGSQPLEPAAPARLPEGLEVRRGGRLQDGGGCVEDGRRGPRSAPGAERVSKRLLDGGLVARPGTPEVHGPGAFSGGRVRHVEVVSQLARARFAEDRDAHGSLPHSAAEHPVPSLQLEHRDRIGPLSVDEDLLGEGQLVVAARRCQEGPPFFGVGAQVGERFAVQLLDGRIRARQCASSFGCVRPGSQECPALPSGIESGSPPFRRRLP